MSTKRDSNKKVLARNKRARFDYDITETFDAGIVLKGSEVKSIKGGHVSLRESFIRVEQNEVWLINAYVSEWKYAQLERYEPQARRKLMLTRREIRKLEILQDAKKMSIVPLEIFLQKKYIKVKIGVGKGRKKYDKRERIKQREMKRELHEDLAKAQRF